MQSGWTHNTLLPIVEDAQRMAEKPNIPCVCVVSRTEEESHLKVSTLKPFSASSPTLRSLLPALRCWLPTTPIPVSLLPLAIPKRFCSHHHHHSFIHGFTNHNQASRLEVADDQDRTFERAFSLLLWQFHSPIEKCESQGIFGGVVSNKPCK